MDLKRLLDKQRAILVAKMEDDMLPFETVRTVRALYDYATSAACLAELQRLEKENRK